METLVPFFVLAVLSIAYPFAVRRLERLRRGLSLGRIPNVTSVWTVPAALALRPGEITLLVAVVYAAEWPSRKAVARGRWGRYIYSAATVVVAAEAAGLIQRTLGGWLGIGGAVLAMQVLQPAALAAAMVYRRDYGNLRQFLVIKSHLFDAGNKALGLLLFAGLSWHVQLAPLAPLVLLAWHHRSFLDVKRAAKAVDEATGLYNEEPWCVAADERRRIATGCITLLMADAPGREREVHDVLRTRLRADDPCGWYAGRVVALVEVGDLAAAGRILLAEVRRELATAGIDCIVGAATSAGELLEDMLIRAGENLMARRAAAGETSPAQS